ncbi:MAG: hypothetical protein AB1502_13170 [Thermodesulfobacteriota bacterium]
MLRILIARKKLCPLGRGVTGLTSVFPPQGFKDSLAGRSQVGILGIDSKKKQEKPSGRMEWEQWKSSVDLNG